VATKPGILVPLDLRWNAFKFQRLIWIFDRGKLEENATIRLRICGICDDGFRSEWRCGR